MTLSSVSLCVFDFSGTISDDRPQAHEAANMALHHFGKPYASFDGCLSANKASAPEFLRHCGVQGNDSELQGVYSRFYSMVSGNGNKPSIYPGAKEVLEYISSKGKYIAVVSSHPIRHLVEESEMYRIKQYISDFVGDSIKKAKSIELVCKKFGVSPAHTAYVGDTVQDIKSAREAGVIPVGVTNGYQKKEFMKIGNDDILMVGSVAELRNFM